MAAWRVQQGARNSRLTNVVRRARSAGQLGPEELRPEDISFSALVTAGRSFLVETGDGCHQIVNWQTAQRLGLI